jgi:ATP-binding cassette subfamily F protein 3
MSLITATNLGKSFGAFDLFLGISLNIPPRARLAIVGPNGIGKTTLLRILIGEDPPSQGQVVRARGVQVGYLPQEATFVDSENSLWEECLAAFEDVRTMEVELAELESQMSRPGLDDETIKFTIERYGKVQARFDHRGGYTYTNQIEQVLTGLGFSSEEFHYPLAHLSGGQRTRALLARLLLTGPDLLVLDEPTNHLDIQAVEWLEGYLSQWEGALLIVSHDRYFMDRVANTIFEMSRNGMETYRGNYSAYLVQRQERWQRRVETFEAEKERLEKEVDYIKRNISGQNTLQAKGRLKRLTRYLLAIEQVGLEAAMSRSWSDLSTEVTTTTSPMSVDEAQRRVRALSLPSHQPQELHLRFKVDHRSGDIVLRARDLEVGYPEKGNDPGRCLFRVPELELRRLECVALIGPNGAGKTTFLKTILGQLKPLAGEVTLGASLKVGYFAQAHEGLNPNFTLVQEIDALAPNMLVAEIRDYLARFLFTREDVFKQVSLLSGGERGRLALAKLAMSNANLLLLDEPTNHLDIPSQEILQEVLARYEGTILLVSHDRFLIDALATQIWEIDEPQQRLHIFEGSYSELRARREAEREALKALAAKSPPPALPTHAPGRASNQHGSGQEGKTARRSTNEERKRQMRITELETLISGLEAQLAVLEERLANPPADALKIQKMGSDYLNIQRQVEDLMSEWESLHS